jgi:hypothetical protein
LKIGFNLKYAQIEFETSLERTTFERYYPIPANSQMEIKMYKLCSSCMRQAERREFYGEYS